MHMSGGSKAVIITDDVDETRFKAVFENDLPAKENSMFIDVPAGKFVWIRSPAVVPAKGDLVFSFK